MEKLTQKTIEEIINNPANSLSQSSKDLLTTIAKQSDINIVKAEKWDALDEEIGKFYAEDEVGEFIEEGCLDEIGLIAAEAFGYL